MSYRLSASKLSDRALTQTLDTWFRDKGFDPIIFEDDRFYYTTNQSSHVLTFKLKRQEGYNSYAMESVGGSLLIFEWKVIEKELYYDCYSPIWLFGIWTLKLESKPKASWISKYREEGYKIEQAFRAFVEMQ